MVRSVLLYALLSIVRGHLYNQTESDQFRRGFSEYSKLLVRAEIKTLGKINK